MKNIHSCEEDQATVSAAKSVFQKHQLIPNKQGKMCFVCCCKNAKAANISLRKFCQIFYHNCLKIWYLKNAISAIVTIMPILSDGFILTLDFLVALLGELRSGSPIKQVVEAPVV